MSISITDVNISYGNNLNGYFSAQLYVTTAGEDLSHLEVVSSVGLTDISQYVSPANQVFELTYGSTTLGMYELVIRAIGLNSSISSDLNVVINLIDRWAPVINSFSIPLVSNSRTVQLNYDISLRINDSGPYEIGVAESNNSGIATWGNITEYTFDSDGNKLLYIWARDLNGNVSDFASAITIIDTVYPEVNFIVPPTSITSHIPITSLIVNDVNSVKYAITTDNIEPLTWLDDQPTEIVVNSDGEYTFYCWVKDIAGNITVVTDTCVVELYRSTVTVNMQTDFASSVVSFSIETEDAYGVLGYYVSDTNIFVEAQLQGIKPVTYAFSNLEPAVNYSFSLYFWVVNNLNNISIPVTKSVNIFIPDTTKPVIESFSMPMAYATSLVPISTLITLDNVSVVGYFISESNTEPVAQSLGWLSEPPIEFLFSGIGLRRAYLWVKDANGNVSNQAWADVSIADTVKPVIKSFKIPSIYNLLTVPIESILATDNTAITGYYISEEQFVPEVESYLWQKVKPVEYQFYTFGSKTLYLTVKDSNNNLSDTIEVSVLLEETVVSNVKQAMLTGTELLTQHLSIKPVSVASIYNFIKARLASDTKYINSMKLQVYSEVLAFRLVSLTEFGIKHTDNNSLESIIGFTITSGEPGFDTEVQYKDVVKNSLWSLDFGKIVYAGLNGSITYDTQVTGIKIGIVVSSDSILLKL